MTPTPLIHRFSVFYANRINLTPNFIGIQSQNFAKVHEIHDFSFQKFLFGTNLVKSINQTMQEIQK